MIATDVATPVASNSLAAARYQRGRYYRESDGTYTSPLIDLGGPVTIRKVGTTVRLPVYVDVDDPDYVLFANGTAAECEVTLRDEAGVPFLPGQELPGGRFRFQVRFDTNLEVADANKPILSSMVFDDITFTYSRGGGNTIVRWESD